MPAKKSKPQGKQLVIRAEDMLMQPFRLHCQTRHPQMRFRTKGEHEADHRLHEENLDHVHAEPEQEKVENAGRQEPNQGTDL